MPIEIRYPDNGLGFLLIAKGIVSGQEILDAIAMRFSSVEKIQKYVYGLDDFTGVDEFDVSTEEVEMVAKEDIDVAKKNPNIVFALTAPQDIIFGMSRMFQVLAQDTEWEIEIFRSLDEAKAWIKGKILEKHNIDVTFQ